MDFSRTTVKVSIYYTGVSQLDICAKSALQKTLTVGPDLPPVPVYTHSYVKAILPNMWVQSNLHLLLLFPSVIHPSTIGARGWLQYYLLL